MQTNTASIQEYSSDDKIFELTAWPVFDDNNQGKAFIHIIKDITERKKAEEEIRETKDILEKIYLGIKDGIVVIDSKTKLITGCNFAAENIFGYKPEEIINKPFKNQFKEKVQICFKKIKHNYSDQIEMNPEISILKRFDDSLFPATYMIFPLFDIENKILRYVAIIRDISEELRVEQERKLNLLKI